jgi:energy-coupling factor transport system substrate-specific component
MSREPGDRWRRIGGGVGWRSTSVLTGLVALGLTWLCWPIWRATTTPTREQASAAAPAVLAALALALVLLAVAVWLDAGREYGPVSLAIALLLANTALRITVNPAASGIEVVHALPLLAGIAAGAPVGFLVGAGGMVLSSALTSTVGTMLPAQALILGAAGALGGLLWHLRPIGAWLASLPLAVASGIGTGVLLNLPGWSQEPGTTDTSFFPGLPPATVIDRLWTYTTQTSLLYDLNRGVTTAVVVLIIGLPVLRSLRALGTGPVDPAAGVPRPGRLSQPALDRRLDRARLDTLWKTGDPS